MPHTFDQRETYQADGITLSDDRSVCAHFGQCTDRLPQVFRATQEPFADPAAATPAQISEVVRGCPSGALALPAEEHDSQSITDRTAPPTRARHTGESTGSSSMNSGSRCR